jgi:uncharacterized membrane protein
VSSGSATRMLTAERRIGRLLIAVTFVSVALLVVGVVLMIVNGVQPLSGGPSVGLGTLGARVTSLQPSGFLWLGLLSVIAAPIGRVIVAAIAYARDGDRLMVGISIAILVVIAVGIGTALTVSV